MIRKTISLDEDALGYLELYAKELEASHSIAASKLIRAGWLSLHQDELANPVIPILRSHLHSLEERIVSEVQVAIEESMDERALDVNDLKRLIVTSMVMDGKLEDEEAAADALLKADSLMGRL